METVVMGCSAVGHQVVMGSRWPDLTGLADAHDRGFRHDHVASLLPVVTLLGLWRRWAAAVKGVLGVLGVLGGRAALLSEGSAEGRGGTGRDVAGLARGEVLLTGRQVFIGAAVWRVAAAPTDILKAPGRVGAAWPGQEVVIAAPKVSHCDSTIASTTSSPISTSTFSHHHPSHIDTGVGLKLRGLPGRRWRFATVGPP